MRYISLQPFVLFWCLFKDSRPWTETTKFPNRLETTKGSSLKRLGLFVPGFCSIFYDFSQCGVFRRATNWESGGVLNIGYVHLFSAFFYVFHFLSYLFCYWYCINALIFLLRNFWLKILAGRKSDYYNVILFVLATLLWSWSEIRELLLGNFLTRKVNFF